MSEHGLPQVRRVLPDRARRAHRGDRHRWRPGRRRARQLRPDLLRRDVTRGDHGLGQALPGRVPSFWQVYITVDDVAATVKQAKSLGAEILMAGEDTPYGTLAAIKDPMGALICLGHPPAGM
ncbi:VOC family protein [Gordonia sp. SMJS1]|nr:VOC family protein [Gordonia sp. SMJS1]WGJ86374.1 VOC family protein [Gordonia sp. SMJS1]